MRPVGLSFMDKGGVRPLLGLYKTESKPSPEHRETELLWAVLGTVLRWGRLAYLKGRSRPDFAP